MRRIHYLMQDDKPVAEQMLHGLWAHMRELMQHADGAAHLAPLGHAGWQHSAARAGGACVGPRVQGGVLVKVRARPVPAAGRVA